jgi:hypothetical protein
MEDGTNGGVAFPIFRERLAAAPSKPASGRLKAIQAQIRDEIPVTQAS